MILALSLDAAAGAAAAAATAAAIADTPFVNTKTFFSHQLCFRRVRALGYESTYFTARVVHYEPGHSRPCR